MTVIRTSSRLSFRELEDWRNGGVEEWRTGGLEE
jgi:hypothetical protein